MYSEVGILLSSYQFTEVLEKNVFYCLRNCDTIQSSDRCI